MAFNFCFLSFSIICTKYSCRPLIINNKLKQLLDLAAPEIILVPANIRLIYDPAQHRVKYTTRYTGILTQPLFAWLGSFTNCICKNQTQLVHSCSEKNLLVILFLSICVRVCVHVLMCMLVCGCMWGFFFSCMCICAHLCGCVCVHWILIDRPEDHCGCPDTVCEEAVGCDDPDRLLPQRLCSDWTTTLYGKPAE